MRSFIILVAIALSVGPSAAEKLPPDAKPMSSQELKAIFAGNSQIWQKSRVYFAPDMTTKGLYGAPVTHSFSGKWNVKGNTICMNNKSIDVKSKKSDGKTYTDCWKFFKSGKRVLSLYSNNFGHKTTENDYWDSELKTLKKGDQISKRYAQYVN